MRTQPALPTGWLDREPDARAVWRELGRLRRRASARPVVTLGVTLLLTLAVVVRQARKHPDYASRVVFRVVEGDLDVSTAPRPDRQLRARVSDVAFASEHLLRVIRTHRLYPSELARGDEEAVTAMREDIDVEVWRNYFYEERFAGDPARSARLAITYHAKDPQLSYEVAQELEQLVVKAQQSGRVDAAEQAARNAAAAVDQARAELYRMRARLVEDQLLAARAGSDSSFGVEAGSLRRSLASFEDQLSRYETRKAKLDLRLAIERRALGLEFQIVDGGHAPPEVRSRRGRLARQGLACFFLLLVLVAIAVGAFDSRIRDVEDIRHLGIEVFGRIPAFPGDRRCALAERRRGEKPEGIMYDDGA